MAAAKIGIWFIGCRGGVATASIVGLAALQKGRIGATGLVSELPIFAHLDLSPWSAFVVGGHDVRDISLQDTAADLVAQAALPAALVDEARRDLARIDKTIRPGTLINVGDAIRDLATAPSDEPQETAQEAIERLQQDLIDFQKRNKLERVVVVNLASTEPSLDHKDLPRRWSQLEERLSDPDLQIGASSIYAIAALDLGFPYINFTPSVGAKPNAINELAEMRETCHMGHDGKTGETLLKTVLAPMFAHRNLHVMSWVGHNIFGNLDGKILDDPENKASKVLSKDHALGQILGYDPQTLVSIEYIRSLGDWKTAWDHIHFRGFLDTPMKLQFTWQGCDSLLAAPLVLDLVRFTERAQRLGQRGVLTFLCSFFKSPLGVRENDFSRQFQQLVDWARQVDPKAK